MSVSASVSALPAILDGQQLVRDYGLPLLLGIVFAETGLLLGFFLPGDSLLFAAGFAASGGIPGVNFPNVAIVCLLMTLAAIAGAHLALAVRSTGGVNAAALCVVHARPQDLHGLGAVLVLATLLLHRHHDPGGKVGEPHR